jgi:hypothetical protein
VGLASRVNLVGPVVLVCLMSLVGLVKLVCPVGLVIPVSLVHLLYLYPRLVCVVTLLLLFSLPWQSFNVIHRA